jgi:predicted esterase
VDTGHALVDEDLISLRKDPRWEKVHQYLEDCNNYFETANIKYTQVLVPKGYRKGKPIPAVVWMHGLGANPENFTNESAQVYADEINIALIGVSGAIEEASEKVTIEKGKVITFGFSQGAQMGLEVAVRYPEEYAGAIVLSPGARSHLNELTASPNLTKRGFVLCCGAQEHPGNVLLTSNDAAWLRRAKAQIIHKPYPGMSAHSFPPDFEDRFPEWIKFILNARGG